jgi:2-isopropylmalate synthase
MFGREQEICIGPMSGVSNVTYWLDAQGHPSSPGLIEAILKVAKQSDHNLSNDEVKAVVERHRRGSAEPPPAS